MQTPHLAQFAPLHKGRSFICYRDVNKAIERHRELYGLRLMLKKAIKLENYCLTVDQMRDLNFRLKYGELDYQCSVDNGRPGRPGKDERCPRLVRIRLSPDARTLVVYDTHVHEPVFNSPSQVQTMSAPYVLQGLLPEIPFKSVSSMMVSPCQTSPTTTACQSTPPPAESSNVKSTNSTTTTPSTSTGYEKITVKLKKSQFSPNEMVVVGSARDAQEQFELRNTPEKTLCQITTSTPKFSEKIDPVALARQIVEKLQENKSTTVVYKPVAKSPPHVVPEVKDVTLPPVSAIAKPLQKIAPKPHENKPPTATDKPNKEPVKPLDKEAKIDKKNEKPAYPYVKLPPKILPKPTKPAEKPEEKLPVKPSQKILPKPAEKTTNRTVDKVPVRAPEKSTAKQNERILGKTVERNGTKGANGKTPVRLSQRCLNKNAQRNGNGSPRNASLMNYSSSGQKSGGNSNSNGNGKRMYRKKRTRQSDPSFDISSLKPLDTELGFGEKQQLAHGVLLRLLRVTSQLPMIEFTQALDTLEMLTDAFKLEQRVNLTISQDEEEEAELKSIEEDYYDEYYNFDSDVSSINEEHRIPITQVDGTVDDSYASSSDSSATSSFYPAQKRPASFPDDQLDLGSVDSEHKNKMQRMSL